MATDESKGVEPAVSHRDGERMETDDAMTKAGVGLAAKFVAEHQNYPPMTPEIEKKLVRKIDGWMIPLVHL